MPARDRERVQGEGAAAVDLEEAARPVAADPDAVRAAPSIVRTFAIAICPLVSVIVFPASVASKRTVSPGFAAVTEAREEPASASVVFVTTTAAAAAGAAENASAPARTTAARTRVTWVRNTFTSLFGVARVYRR